VTSASVIDGLAEESSGVCDCASPTLLPELHHAASAAQAPEVKSNKNVKVAVNFLFIPVLKTVREEMETRDIRIPPSVSPFPSPLLD
jgi:hypothetical protein